MVRRAASRMVLAIVVIAGCSQVLGLKQAKEADDPPAIDAAIAAPAIDGAIDTSAVEPPIDAAADAAVDTAAIDAPIDTPGPSCVPSACQFGCDPNTDQCRESKLWIFKTESAFLGNAFGGVDTPPMVRAGADGKCLIAYGDLPTSRQCSNGNVHAILYVNAGDSIALMAAKYAIPTTVPVYRAEDNVLVSNNWNDLTDPTKQLRAPATTAATDAEGLVWTGANPQNTCTNWTAGVSTSMGTRGYASRIDASWLAEDSSRCDRLASLLCICWPGNP